MFLITFMLLLFLGTGRNRKINGKGNRWIVVDAGGTAGWVPNCLTMYRSSSSGDYHEEINFERYKSQDIYYKQCAFLYFLLQCGSFVHLRHN